MTDKIINEAIKLKTKLEDLQRELTNQLLYCKTEVQKELNIMDQKTCLDSAAMLKKLGTEVTRLRLTIEHFNAGCMSKFELLQATRNWNDDPT